MRFSVGKMYGCSDCNIAHLCFCNTDTTTLSQHCIRVWPPKYKLLAMDDGSEMIQLIITDLDHRSIKPRAEQDSK